MADVQIYTTRVCGYCIAAKRLLSAKEIPYEEIDVTGDDARRGWLVETTGRRTVPQIFIKGQSVGGYDELSGLDRSGRLAEMLGHLPEHQGNGRGAQRGRQPVLGNELRDDLGDAASEPQRLWKQRRRMRQRRLRPRAPEERRHHGEHVRRRDVHPVTSHFG